METCVAGCPRSPFPCVITTLQLVGCGYLRPAYVTLKERDTFLMGFLHALTLRTSK